MAAEPHRPLSLLIDAGLFFRGWLLFASNRDQCLGLPAKEAEFNLVVPGAAADGNHSVGLIDPFRRPGKRIARVRIVAQPVLGHGQE